MAHDSGDTAQRHTSQHHVMAVSPSDIAGHDNVHGDGIDAKAGEHL